MSIAHSTRSCGRPCGGNLARTKQSGPSGAKARGAKGSKAPTAKERAPTKVNPIRPRYGYSMVTNLPETAKSATGEEVMSTSTHRAIRGDWGGRAPKDRPVTSGDPARRRHPGEKRGVCAVDRGSRVRRNGRERTCASTTRRALRGWPRPRGIHNPLGGRGRDSEGSIVAMKRGNARRAKGPHFSHVAIEERKPA